MLKLFTDTQDPRFHLYEMYFCRCGGCKPYSKYILNRVPFYQAGMYFTTMNRPHCDLTIPPSHSAWKILIINFWEALTDFPCACMGSLWALLLLHSMEHGIMIEVFIYLDLQHISQVMCMRVYTQSFTVEKKYIYIWISKYFRRSQRPTAPHMQN